MNVEQLIPSKKKRDFKQKKLKVVYLPRNKKDTNPYQAQLAQKLTDLGMDVEGAEYQQWFLLTALKQWKADIIHLHWLQSFFVRSSLTKSLVSMMLFVGQLLILRLLGTKIVWTVHNLKNHNNRFLISERIGKLAVSNIADGIIAHCQLAKEEIVSNLKTANPDKIFVVPHGNYIECYENKINRQEARRQLNISDSDVVLLFFGLIRPYKGVLEMVKALEEISLPKVKLLIVGKLWQDTEEFDEVLRQKAANDLRIVYRPGFVPDELIQVYMNACNLVVFPYRDILTSGAVLLAMSFGKACLAPKIGCIGEILDKKGAFLYNPNKEDGLIKATQAAVNNSSVLNQMGEYNYQKIQQYSWQNVAQQTLKIYDAIII